MDFSHGKSDRAHHPPAHYSLTVMVDIVLQTILG